MSFEAHPLGKARIDENHCVVLDHEELHGVDFSGRNLVQFSAVGSRLEGCQFDNAKIDDASFGAGPEISEYVECSFDGARIGFGPGGYTRFVRCSFQNVDLRDWFCFTSSWSTAPSTVDFARRSSTGRPTAGRWVPATRDEPPTGRCRLHRQ